MRKVVFVLCIVLCSLVANAFKQVSTSSVVRDPLIAVDNFTGTLYYATCVYKETKEGTDAEVCIFDSEFNVQKKFTLPCEKVTFDDGEEGVLPIREIMPHTIDVDEIVATKGVFSDKDKWCVLKYDTTSPNLKVYDEDGRVVGEVVIPPDPEDSYIPVEFFFANVTTGKVFLHIDRHVCKFVGTSGISEPTVIKSTTRAYPNPIEVSRKLTIELDRPAERGTVVVINSLRGHQLLRERLDEGQTTVIVPGYRLHKGMNIYTIIYPDGSCESGKLIAN